MFSFILKFIISGSAINTPVLPPNFAILISTSPNALATFKFKNKILQINDQGVFSMEL